MASLALSFHDVKFNPVNHSNEVWLKSAEIAEALGYKQADAVTKIYNRNSDEFNDSMTQVIANPQTPNLGVRIFSLRGCHLLAMFARTAVAKEFRKWVLDVLDREVNRHTTVQDREPLNKAIVMLVAASGRLKYSDAYKLVHNRFGVEHTHELTPSQLNQAIDYVHWLILQHANTMQMADGLIMSISALCTHMAYLRSWWSKYSDPIKALNRNIAASVHDHFADGNFTAGMIAHSLKIEMPDQRHLIEFQWDLPPHERMARAYRASKR